jgi:hypothetical protein
MHEVTIPWDDEYSSVTFGCGWIAEPGMEDKFGADGREAVIKELEEEGRRAAEEAAANAGNAKGWDLAATAVRRGGVPRTPAETMLNAAPTVPERIKPSRDAIDDCRMGLGGREGEKLAAAYDLDTKQAWDLKEQARLNDKRALVENANKYGAKPASTFIGKKLTGIWSTLSGMLRDG